MWRCRYKVSVCQWRWGDRFRTSGVRETARTFYCLFELWTETAGSSCCLFLMLISSSTNQIRAPLRPEGWWSCAELLHAKWAAHWGVMLDSWEAVFLSWSWPRNALILFIIIVLFPPAYCICTLNPAIFIHTARLLISWSNVGLKNGNGTWKRSWTFIGASSNWCILDFFEYISFCIFLMTFCRNIWNTMFYVLQNVSQTMSLFRDS